MASDAAVPRPRTRPPWVEALSAQLLALVAAFAFAGLAAAIIILIYGENPVFVYRVIWAFSTAQASDIGKVLENATPLIFSGLAVAVAFKAGMFNIGVEGQYIVAMMTAASAAIFLDFLPGPLHLLVVILAAMAGSVAWAFVPAILKVKTGAHEVVTTIMMNGIAVSLVAWALLNPLRTSQTGLVDLRSDRFAESARVPRIAETLGLEGIPASVYLTWLFPLAILACVFVWYLLYRTRLGYEVRAVGASSGSAEAGGISIGATQLKIFLISGALAGFVGLNHLLGQSGFLGINYETALGFTGIAVAFLGRNSPIGIPLAAILFGILSRGEDGIAIETDLPREIVVILQGILILSVVVAYEIVRRVLVRRRQRRIRAEEEVPDAAA
jgi:ABC-type uncharacterized transport system permease subunit